MFIGLDKLINQAVKKVIVAVPERSIGSSFKNTDLKSYGFFADWEVKSALTSKIPSNLIKKFSTFIVQDAQCIP